MSAQDTAPDLVGQIGDRLRELSECYDEVIAAAEAAGTHAEAEQRRYGVEGSDIAALYAATATAMGLIATQLNASKAAVVQLLTDAPKLRGVDSDEAAVVDATKLRGEIHFQFDLRNQAQRTLWDAKARLIEVLERKPTEFSPLDDAFIHLGNTITAAKDSIGDFITSVEKGPTG